MSLFVPLENRHLCHLWFTYLAELVGVLICRLLKAKAAKSDDIQNFLVDWCDILDVHRSYKSKTEDYVVYCQIIPRVFPLVTGPRSKFLEDFGVDICGSKLEVCHREITTRICFVVLDPRSVTWGYLWDDVGWPQIPWWRNLEVKVSAARFEPNSLNEILDRAGSTDLNFRVELAQNL